jgi:hypothetical protein
LNNKSVLELVQQLSAAVVYTDATNFDTNKKLWYEGKEGRGREEEGRRERERRGKERDRGEETGRKRNVLFLKS